MSVKALYSSLGEAEIRVFTFLLWAESEPIQGTLRPISLSGPALNYEALSWTCGRAPLVFKRKIIVNGSAFTI